MEDIEHIKTREVDGDKHSAARNQHRVVVEVESAAANTTVRTKVLRKGDVAQIEFYVDELRGLLERVRDDKQRAAWQMAEQFAKGQTDEWLKEEYPTKAKAGRLDEIPRERWEKRCNVHPSLYLASLGYPKGIGALERADVVDPNDTSRKIPLGKFLELNRDKQSDWLIDPPMTAANAHVIAADHTAEALARALARVLPNGNQGNGNRKG